MLTKNSPENASCHMPLRTKNKRLACVTPARRPRRPEGRNPVSHMVFTYLRIQVHPYSLVQKLPVDGLMRRLCKSALLSHQFNYQI